MKHRKVYDKFWQSHIVKSYDDGRSLSYIGRHRVQEVSSPQAFSGLDTCGSKIRRQHTHPAVAEQIE